MKPSPLPMKGKEMSEVKRIEKCNKCGNENFAVARNMIGTRICKCGNTWAPGEAQGEFCKHGTHESHYCGSCNKESYDSLKKENEELKLVAEGNLRISLKHQDKNIEYLKQIEELKARIGKLEEVLYAAENLISYETPLAMSPKAAAMKRYERAMEALKEDGNG